jgi:hypothetical protein
VSWSYLTPYTSALIDSSVTLGAILMAVAGGASQVYTDTRENRWVSAIIFLIVSSLALLFAPPIAIVVCADEGTVAVALLGTYSFGVFLLAVGACWTFLME